MVSGPAEISAFEKLNDMIRLLWVFKSVTIILSLACGIRIAEQAGAQQEVLRF